MKMDSETSTLSFGWDYETFIVELIIDLRKADGNGMTWIYHTFKVDGSNI